MSVVILGPLSEGGIKLSLYSFQVPAGFASPAVDYIEKHVSLDELAEVRAARVYLAKILGDSMIGAGIFDKDLIVVDRSRTAEHGEIVVAALNNSEPICKRLLMDGVVKLQSENSAYPSKHILEGDNLVIWGVVNYSMRRHVKA
ncbi:Ultraviolet light resistance protein A [Pseudomonas coronafaciens pv. zizaniae]|uniref:LexA family protein n=1 Tax=Pseudomonas coronafaciens TaxID=53409 RepID=UPI000EFE4D88|nr:S24 family peptidase [Pseudomonas coronafaciens]RMN26990.1 Ultraviolet light resistance protein A [Pseudomonas coronafaciens pv. zizaniae]